MVLSANELNRATLQRQFLLAPSALPALEVIRHVVGFQSQAPDPPYIGLWTRMSAFQPAELEQLLVSRAAVRIAVMRSTIHLVTADDCLNLRFSVQPAIDRGLKTGYGKLLVGVEPEDIAATTRRYLQGGAATLSDIGTHLSIHFPEREVSALSAAARAYVLLLQPPPRGLWRAGGLAKHLPANTWIGQPCDAEADLERLIFRYLAAFGPASIMDMQAWSGLTRLSGTLEGIRDQLVSYRDESGRELFDLPGLPLPEPESAAPVRFLPEWDNVLLAYASKGRVLPVHHVPRVFTKNGIFKATILVDGYVAGIWRSSRSGDVATLDIESFESFSRQTQDAVHQEGLRLLDFLEPDAPVRNIEFDQ